MISHFQDLLVERLRRVDVKMVDIGFGHDLDSGIEGIQADMEIKKRTYLLEINSLAVAHISEENPNYSLAQKLEKEGFIKLIESRGPLIRTVLTEAGKRYIENDRTNTNTAI